MISTRIRYRTNYHEFALNKTLVVAYWELPLYLNRKSPFIVTLIFHKSVYIQGVLETKILSFI